MKCERVSIDGFFSLYRKDPSRRVLLSTYLLTSCSLLGTTVKDCNLNVIKEIRPVCTVLALLSMKLPHALPEKLCEIPKETETFR